MFKEILLRAATLGENTGEDGSSLVLSQSLLKTQERINYGAYRIS